MKKKIFVPRTQIQDAPHPLDAQPSRDTQALVLPLSVIRVPTNIRQQLEGIEDLAESIKAHGLLQALVVSKVSGGFELVAGQRRYRALKLAGMETAPVRILNVGEDQVAVLRLIENIQRQELSGADEVRAVTKLLPTFDGNQALVARAIGKSPAYVSRCIKAARMLDADAGLATSQVSKSMLFEAADAANPDQLLKLVKDGAVKTVQEARARSGPVAGGRYGADGALQYKERPDGRSFSLRLNWDAERTPTESKAKIISTLETILTRLRGAGIAKP